MGMPTTPLLALMALALLLCISMSMDGCSAAEYKVGGLDAWGVPPSTKPDVYVRWAKSVPVKLGDALFFLYPPSQDSAVQVTAKAFAACDVSGPLLKLDDGNSVFNLTRGAGTGLLHQRRPRPLPQGPEAVARRAHRRRQAAQALRGRRGRAQGAFCAAACRCPVRGAALALPRRRGFLGLRSSDPRWIL